MDKSFISKDQWNHPCFVAIQTNKGLFLVKTAIAFIKNIIKFNVKCKLIVDLFQWMTINKNRDRGHTHTL